MKKVNIIIILLIIFVVGSYAQNATQARTVLNKTASILNRKGGLSFNFSMTGSKTGSVSGTIAIRVKNIMSVYLKRQYGSMERRNGHI